jgi:peptidoglycan hydrolase-like protein with peptidoglycan-binding domain
VRPSSLLAVAVSAVLGVALGIGGGLVLDRGSDTVEDPLSLGVPMVNQSCTGEFLLAIGKGGLTTLANALSSNPSGHYLDTQGSCRTAWTDSARPTPRWVAYLGPYESGARACEDRMTADHKGSTVTQLKSGTPDTLHCVCYLDFRSMPTLRTGMAAGTTDGMWTRALQNMLVDLGLAKKDDTTGVYDLTTAAHVRQLQRDNNIGATGVVHADTWQALKGEACPLYDVASTNASP